MLTGKDIRKLSILTPIIEKQKCNISYGLEPSGYTLRLDNVFKLPVRNYMLLDPMDPELSERAFKTVHTDVFILKPQSFVLAKSLEKFDMPTSVTAIALTKSTYARLGIFANITTIDPGWRGYLTIEIANLGRNSVKIYANYGIAEVLFFKHEDTEGYDGKYQDLKDVKV